MALARFTFMTNPKSFDKIKTILAWSFVTQLTTHLLAFGFNTYENMTRMGAQRVFCDEMSMELLLTVKQHQGKYF